MVFAVHRILGCVSFVSFCGKSQDPRRRFSGVSLCLTMTCVPSPSTCAAAWDTKRHDHSQVATSQGLAEATEDGPPGGSGSLDAHEHGIATLHGNQSRRSRVPLISDNIIIPSIAQMSTPKTKKIPRRKRPALGPRRSRGRQPFWPLLPLFSVSLRAKCAGDGLRAAASGPEVFP